MMIRKLHKKTTEIKPTLVWRGVCVCVCGGGGGSGIHISLVICIRGYTYIHITGVHISRDTGTVGREGLVH